MVRPRIRETIQALGRAARSAGLGFADLDRVLLVGGSSRIPLVAEMVREATGKPVAVDAHPKHTMALGAAYVAEQRSRGRRRDARCRRGSRGGVRHVAGGRSTGGGRSRSRRRSRVRSSPARRRPASVDRERGAGRSSRRPSPPCLHPHRRSRWPHRPLRAPTGGGRRVSVPMAAILAGIAFVAVIAIGGSGLLGGRVGRRRHRHRPRRPLPSSPRRRRHPPPSPSPTASPTPTPVPTPTPEPTPIADPGGSPGPDPGHHDRAGTPTSSTRGLPLHPGLPGTRHVHFFCDTIPPTKAGRAGTGPNWILYDGPVAVHRVQGQDRPNGAKQMCILVANHDHSVVQNTGNCVDLPD